MRTKNILILLFLFFLIFPIYLSAQITKKPSQLIIENEQVRKTIQFSETKPDAITIKEIYSKTKNQNLISEKNTVPYFEFVINKKLITSTNKVWQFQKYETRKMGNNGTELKITFSGKKGALKNIELVLYQQIFPNATLIREKIQINNPKDADVKLNKYNEKLHFVFPQYNLTNIKKPEVTEIRIASWAKEKINYTPGITYDDRTYDGGDNFNLAHCHMFHPEINQFTPQENKEIAVKGPFNILKSENYNWLSAYEHASQDTYDGMRSYKKKDDNNSAVDALQGVEGTFTFEEKDENLRFIEISQTLNQNELKTNIHVNIGGYLEGEQIQANRPYESVWCASAFYFDEKQTSEIIHNYLFYWICEKTASRQPTFYYNTWGMQRDMAIDGHDLREIFTQERIKKEIQHAGELNVDYFVLDDGWEEAQGIWTANSNRLPNGLAPLRKEIEKNGMKMGIWLSPMGIDKTTERYKKHQKWVILDQKGVPIKAQWGHPAFDFVSDFYDLFIEDCKKLIDQGTMFFKWDAINTFNSTLPNLHHGSDDYTELEIKQRYEYLLPIYVTKAMEELTNYKPELVIEIDLTEARRAMVGLAPLSQGKYFWMNNGASGYNDYSPYRAKSMRTIVSTFNSIIPLELFTFANYPQNTWPFFTQRYNINTSLIAGHGFWGNLDKMTTEQRQRIGKQVAKSKRILPYTYNQPTQIIGDIGSSPEIYIQTNNEKTAGQIIAFSGQALKHEFSTPINKKNVLAILNHAYQIKDDKLQTTFEFVMPDDTRELFIIPNKNSDISIFRSTSWLDDVKLVSPTHLEFINGAKGEHEIFFQGDKEPQIKGQDIDFTTQKFENGYIITIKTTKKNTLITIKNN